MPNSSAKRRSRRRGGGGGPATTQARLTSHPTTRAAYTETRHWLLDAHGPICAYCAGRFRPQDMTLDHVTPRRGQSAYDRRDNLVLACKTCNAAKADKPILAFLLGRRDRAISLYRYGDHLSGMLRDMARQLAGEEADVIDAERETSQAARAAEAAAEAARLAARKTGRSGRGGGTAATAGTGSRRSAARSPNGNGQRPEPDSPYRDEPAVLPRRRRPIPGDESPYQD